MVSNIYYYQDSLGSTSHIASASGALLEYYKYDLYGKPTYWNANNTQLSTSNYSVRDLFTGQRWVAEIGLYDDRNRYMSPDLGRFLQPDPIGFKGDGSNLYRYCGNDWANRTDPMGLRTEVAGDLVQFIVAEIEPVLNKASNSSANPAGITFAQISAEPEGKKDSPPTISPSLIREGMKATDDSVRKQDSKHVPHSEVSYTDAKGQQAYTKPEPGRKIGEVWGRLIYEERVTIPQGATARIIGHSHLPGDSAFSDRKNGGDIQRGATIPVMKNLDRHPGYYDLYYKGWRFYIKPNGEIMGSPRQYP